MIRAALDRFDSEQRAMLGQLARYAVVGGIITLAFSAAYWAGTEFLHIDPMVSLTLVFIIFSVISYFTHGAYSFRDHGQRDDPHKRLGRFVAVNLIGFALNQLFVWTLVKQLHGPTWWPTIPFVLVTPLVTFALHRRYVFA